MVNDAAVGVACSEERAMEICDAQVKEWAASPTPMYRHVHSFDMAGPSWLWQDRDHAVLMADGDATEALGVLREFDEDEWEAVAWPRPGLVVYRRATLWDRLTRWLR